MSDTVTVRSEVDYVCWKTPDFVGIHVTGGDERDSCFEVDVEQVGPEVIDALASRWLDHLYARLNRPSPFKNTQL